ncbi:MAG TPA: IS66 family transposase [Thiolapillus brandeum]|uniref:IS66 family transposase n=1 Tax=Thiolapillus brandeum TaxID=1076588 RepID=A0A831W992_9GAMM|nr:IS66 family transposase [Thiolapillus brandeum]
MLHMEAAVSIQEITPAFVQELVSEISNLRQQNQALQSQLDWFKKQIFGQKSEKRLVEIPGQLELGELLDGEKPAAPEVPTETITYIRRKKQRGDDCATDEGLRFDQDVPVEVIEIGHPALRGAEADDYEPIDYKITHKLAQRPGSYVVLEYRRPVLKHKPTQTLSTPPLPTPVLDRCLADVSLLVGLLIDKFLYHLPLYRQHQRMQLAGIQLSRTTLTIWVQRTIDLLKPIYEAQLRNILLSRVLAMDETPIKAGRRQKGKMHQGWLWPIYGEGDEVCFTYSPGRGSQHLEALLKEFEGVLLTDGYAAYDRFARNKPEITQAQCWAHARRYFVRAESIEPKAVAEALEQIGALYRIEEEIRKKELRGEEKLAYRSRQSKPLADDFFAWCHEQRQRFDLVNSNPLSKALVYVANHQEQMSVFLSDPDVPIDTNHVERNLRGIPLGRKNWMFCWTEVGAEQVGIIQSLLVTCRLQGVNPYTYLVDVLQRIALHPAREVEALTPRRWKECFAGNPLRAPLDRLQ